MKTITQMRADIASLMEKVDGINTRCQADDREASVEERGVIKKVLARVKDLEDLISMNEDVERTQDRLSEPTTDPILPDPENRGAGFTIEDQEDRDQFGSFGEQMAAVMRAGNGNGVDARLITRAASGMNEAVGSQGGFLVQQDFSSEMLKNVFDTGILAARCKRLTISGNSNSIKLNGVDETSRATGSRWGGVRGYWTEEAGEKTSSKPKFRKIELNLHKLIGLAYATDELLDDASALGSVLSTAFAEEFGFLVDEGIFNGNGVGQPLGILNGGGLVTQNKETGQPAATVVYENIVNMWSRLLAKSRPNAIWCISQDIEPQLHTMSLAVGTGGSAVYLPPGGASGSPYATLYGRPVIAIEQCKTLGTKGDILLGDFSNGYILADKGGIASDVSIHVRFIYDESVFRFVIRLDGQPVLASALTPFNTGATQSHFVTLQARS